MPPCSDPTSDWRPTAAWGVLHGRAMLLRAVREWFWNEGFVEVETPILSREFVDDGWIEPIRAGGRTSPTTRYLQPSPELHMKRLLAAGSPSIFQLAKVFRHGEVGPLHNPEFTLLEWYRLGEDDAGGMNFTERLLRHVVEVARSLPETVIGPRGRPVWSAEPFARLSYAEAFHRFCQVDVLNATADDLRDFALRQNLAPPESLSDDVDDWRNFLLAELVEPQLASLGPVFLTDYPASQAALAQTSNGPVATAHRFELYAGGMELCNGYWELTDPDELARRLDERRERKRQQGETVIEPPASLLAAMQAGLPAMCGVALGLDRLIMLALGYASIADVIPFPSDRA